MIKKPWIIWISKKWEFLARKPDQLKTSGCWGMLTLVPCWAKYCCYIVILNSTNGGLGLSYFEIGGWGKVNDVDQGRSSLGP